MTSPSGLGITVSYTGTGSTTYGPSATAPTNPGTYSVVATVVDPNYAGQQSGTLTINQVDPTVTLGLVSGSPTSTPYGTTVYFAFNTTSAPQCPTGTVQLYIDGVASGSPVTLTSTTCAQPIQFQIATLTAGAHSIYAAYSGDTYFIAENSTPLSYTVSQDGTTVTLATSSGTVNVGQPVTYTATVNPIAADNAAPPTGTVAFFDGSTQIGTGSTLTASSPYTSTFTTSSLAAGTHSITASFTDTDGNFVGSSSAIQTETVNLIVPTINWTPAATTFAYGTALDSTELNATAVDGGGNPIAGSFSYNFPLGTVLGVGTANVTATFTPTDPTTYSSNSATITFTVNAVALTVTPDNLSMVYGAAVPTLTYQITGFVNSDPSSVVSGTASCTTTATSTSPVGGYTITCTQGTLAASNYTFQFVGGTLNVTQATTTVSAWPTASAITYGQTLASCVERRNSFRRRHVYLHRAGDRARRRYSCAKRDLHAHRHHRLQHRDRHCECNGEPGNADGERMANSQRHHLRANAGVVRVERRSSFHRRHVYLHRAGHCAGYRYVLAKRHLHSKRHHRLHHRDRHCERNGEQGHADGERMADGKLDFVRQDAGLLDAERRLGFDRRHVCLHNANHCSGHRC
jgi:hypothetical protein